MLELTARQTSLSPTEEKQFGGPQEVEASLGVWGERMCACVFTHACMCVCWTVKGKKVVSTIA